MSDEEEYFIVKNLHSEDIESPSIEPSQELNPSFEENPSLEVKSSWWLFIFFIFLILIIYQAYTHSK